MPRRLKILLMVAGVAMGAIALWHRIRPREVFDETYKGRTLVYWTAHDWHQEGKPEMREEAANAIRVLCSNNLPALVTGLNYDPGFRQMNLERDTSWLPGGIQDWLMAGPLADHAEQRASAAEAAFHALGPAAAAAIPEIEGLILGTNFFVSQRAYRILPYLGSNSVPWLLSLMADENYSQQEDAVHTFCILAMHLRTNTSPEALPVLLRCMQSPHPYVVAYAAGSLGNMKLAPETCVHALIGALTNESPRCRMSVIHGLGDYGKEARAALPALTLALQDSETDVRKDAAEALVKIAPDIYTNPSSVAPGKSSKELFRERYGLVAPH